MGNESELMKYIENIYLDTEESDLRTVNINNMEVFWLVKNDRKKNLIKTSRFRSLPCIYSKGGDFYVQHSIKTISSITDY